VARGVRIAAGAVLEGERTVRFAVRTVRSASLAVRLASGVVRAAWRRALEMSRAVLFGGEGEGAASREWCKLEQAPEVQKDRRPLFVAACIYSDHPMEVVEAAVMRDAREEAPETFGACP
jgi:hypothetical protein